MPITATVDQTARRLHTLVTGILHYDDFLHHLKETRPRLAPGYPELFDARRVRTDLTTAQVRDLSYAAQDVTSRGEIGATAIVATDDKLFGMARMYAGFCEGYVHPVHVFRELIPAEEWLATLKSGPPNPKAEGIKKITPVLAFIAQGYGLLQR